MGFSCRLCGDPLERTVVDLGMSPLANSYVEPDRIAEPEAFHPLHVFICDACLLVQLPPAASPEAIFGDYAYFSSFSSSWVDHARRAVEDLTTRYGLGADSLVVEIASNDGYLLQHVRARGIRALGIEPAANVAEVAVAKGIPTRVAFFGRALADELVNEGTRADLLIGNNVLAHVPDLNDFVAGIARLLAPGGVAALEFPHLLRLLDETQFDTIYHEHFSYFSFTTVRRAFAAHGLTLIDVEEQSTHGGSIRIHARHDDNQALAISPRVAAMLAKEEAFGILDFATYERFARQVVEVKEQLLEFLFAERRGGRLVVGYGAPAKGNTLLNYCGVKPEHLPFTVDLSPHKQGRLLPGTRIPIRAPEAIDAAKPDTVLILPWNLRAEIGAQMARIREWGGRFAVAIPRLARD
jgi:SAM-dependent methyltransferase